MGATLLISKILTLHKMALVTIEEVSNTTTCNILFLKLHIPWHSLSHQNLSKIYTRYDIHRCNIRFNQQLDISYTVLKTNEWNRVVISFCNMLSTYLPQKTGKQPGIRETTTFKHIQENYTLRLLTLNRHLICSICSVKLNMFNLIFIVTEKKTNN